MGIEYWNCNNHISENKLIYVPMRVLANKTRDISISKKKLKNDIKYKGIEGNDKKWAEMVGMVRNSLK